MLRHRHPPPSQLTGASATEADQTYTITATASPEIFDLLSVSASNVLSYRLKPGTPAGNATVTVRIRDNGGTANGGDDTSPSVTFTITVNGVNDEPSFTSGGDVTVNEDSGAYSAAWATAISAAERVGSDADLLRLGADQCRCE